MSRLRSTGAKLSIFVFLGEFPDPEFVQIEDNLPVAELKNRIKAVWGAELEGTTAGKLVVRTKDATNTLHLLNDAKLKLAEALACNSEGECDVFVEVPPKAADSVIVPDDTSLSALSTYLLLSHHIRSSPQWKAVDDKIEECAADPAQPFILLDGPSGVGKTQLALSQKKKSIYLLLTPPKDDLSQPVYKPFYRQSVQLLVEIKKDIAQLLKKGTDTFDMAQIFLGEEYLTLGYLARLWHELDRQPGEEWPMRQALLSFRFQSVAMSIEKFRKHCPSFLLLLDETPPIVGTDEQKKMLVKFIRNLGRKVGVAVLLGTDSTLSNAVDCCGSREEAGPWCHVFTGYPRPTVASLAVRFPDIKEWVEGKRCSKPLTDFLNYVIHSHRPWLTTLFLKSLMGSNGKGKSDLEILQDVCGKVGNTTTKAKYMQKGVMWFVGQKRLPLCTYRAVHRPFMDHLVHGHMAYLGLPDHAESVTLELGSNGLQCNGKAFKPFAYFPSAAREALLYLGLLQSPSTNAFTDPDSGKRMATCQAYETSLDTSHKVDLANSQAIKKNGDQYEVILAVGMIVASHEAWLDGQTAYSFLPRLFYEVCGVQADLSKDSTAFVKKRFRERKIGYLSPLRSAWPEAVVQFPGALVATPCRPPDKKRFDVDCMPCEDVKFESEDDEEEDDEGDTKDEDYEEAEEAEDEGYEREEDEEDANEEAAGEKRANTVRLTGEAKNRKNKFSLSEMVKRIPAESELHVVLGYAIVKKPQKATREIIRANDALVVRLVCQAGQWSLQPVLNVYKARHLVILIDKTEIEQLKRKA